MPCFVRNHDFQLEKELPAKLQGTEILQDDLNNFLVPRQGLVCFNDPHPSEMRECKGFIKPSITSSEKSCQLKYAVEAVESG
eukprot:317406-Pelagomonas_calceolata.AAC.1